MACLLFVWLVARAASHGLPAAPQRLGARLAFSWALVQYGWHLLEQLTTCNSLCVGGEGAGASSKQDHARGARAQRGQQEDPLEGTVMNNFVFVASQASNKPRGH